ncbi:MAG: hypothetical protein ACFFCS_28340 [Candidatus Hodarchaeota archaeon]
MMPSRASLWWYAGFTLYPPSLPRRATSLDKRYILGAQEEETRGMTPDENLKITFYDYIILKIMERKQHDKFEMLELWCRDGG